MGDGCGSPRSRRLRLRSTRTSIRRGWYLLGGTSYQTQVFDTLEAVIESNRLDEPDVEAGFSDLSISSLNTLFAFRCTMEKRCVKEHAENGNGQRDESPSKEDEEVRYIYTQLFNIRYISGSAT